MPSIESDFVAAIHDTRCLVVRYRAKDGGARRRLAAPLDYGPVHRGGDRSNRFQFWDLESPRGPHWTSIAATNLLSVEDAGMTFDPHEIVDWDVADAPWTIARDWGTLS